MYPYVLADGSKTSVALHRVFTSSVSVTAQEVASFNVFVINANADRVFPIPISSAMIPPPVSSTLVLDLAPVTL